MNAVKDILNYGMVITVYLKNNFAYHINYFTALMQIHKTSCMCSTKVDNLFFIAIKPFARLHYLIFILISF